jgi:hypothetical protein
MSCRHGASPVGAVWCKHVPVGAGNGAGAGAGNGNGAGRCRSVPRSLKDRKKRCIYNLQTQFS